MDLGNGAVVLLSLRDFLVTGSSSVVMEEISSSSMRENRASSFCSCIGGLPFNNGVPNGVDIGVGNGVAIFLPCIASVEKTISATNTEPWMTPSEGKPMVPEPVRRCCPFE